MNWKRWKSQSTADKMFDILNHLILVVITIVCLYPLYYIVIISFSEDVAGTYFYPGKFTLEGYKAVFKDTRIWLGYFNTLLYVVGGVCFSLVLTLPCAYALSRKDFVGRKAITVYLLVTMFISGGMIPTYLVVQNLGLMNTRLLIILLTGCGVYNIVVARTFFAVNISDELLEAAQIDGCGNAKFFIKIVLPLSKAICAVLALWIGVGRWNSYFTEMIYLRDEMKYPLGLYLRKVLWTVQSLLELVNQQNAEGGLVSATVSEQVKLASIMQYVVIVCSTLPMMIIYPFLQKYFAKGVMVGAVKG